MGTPGLCDVLNRSARPTRRSGTSGRIGPDLWKEAEAARPIFVLTRSVLRDFGCLRANAESIVRPFRTNPQEQERQGSQWPCMVELPGPGQGFQMLPDPCRQRGLTDGIVGYPVEGVEDDVVRRV